MTQVPARRAGYPLLLLGIFLAFAAILGIAPWYRQDWLLENVLVVISVCILVYSYRHLRFSNTAYTLLFVFMIAHEIGAHYTYAEVPYSTWISGWTGLDVTRNPGWQRNHYDRVIHFAYGLLITLPAVELLQHVAAPTRIWRFILPVLFMLSHAALYELIEWAAALVFSGDLGMAYLGTQGDEWDSQKDTACAGFGAVLAVAILGVSGRLRPPIRLPGPR